MRLGDVQNLVPNFDGRNMPLNNYICACNNAAKLVAENDRSQFLTIVQLKLSGVAADIIESKTYDTLDSLLRDLKNAFDKPVELSDLETELKSNTQNYSESVLLYATRTRKIANKTENRLKEVYRAEAQQAYLNGRINEVRQTVIRTFIRGLADQIGNMIMPRNFPTLEEAIDEALNIENELIRRQAMHQTSKLDKSETRDKSPEKAKVRFTQDYQQQRT